MKVYLPDPYNLHNLLNYSQRDGSSRGWFPWQCFTVSLKDRQDISEQQWVWGFFPLFKTNEKNVYLKMFFTKFSIKHREYLTPNSQKFAYVY